MSEMIKCSQCAAEFPAANVISYEGQNVCLACKDAFIAKLRQGGAVSSGKFAGFWIRLGAKTIDGIILGLANVIITVLVNVIIPVDARNMSNPGYLLTLLLNLTTGIAYSTIMVVNLGATVGKMACGIKIIRSNGDGLTYGRAFGRYWAEVLSSLTLLIGYIMAGFDDEKRALHDRVCDTRVVYTK